MGIQGQAPQPQLSSTFPMPMPTIELARYCIPSKRPAAVAAALRPPKSMEAAPPIIPWAPFTKNERTARHKAGAHAPRPRRLVMPRAHSVSAIPMKPYVMTGARRPP